MIIDSSAIIAILFDEPESERIVAAMARDPRRLISAATLVEAAAVALVRKGPQAELALDALLRRLGISVVELSPEGAAYARTAYARFGKTVGAPAVLNYGDCLAYGAAMALGEPLLFKGSDFEQTDVPAVAY